MSELQTFVYQGILYEEQFVEMYFKVLRDEGFMEYFDANQAEAKQLFTTMIEDSARHKQDLEDLKLNVK